MAKQEAQEQQAQGSALAPQQGNKARAGIFPAAMMLAPGDLLRMGPFTLMRRMSEEMDRVFGEFGLNRGEGGKTVWAPAIEVSQADGKYMIRAELPGVNPGDVKLEITNEAVILEGERKSERQENKGNVHLTERQYGHFYRAIPLPEGAKVEEARAKFANGLLEVTVPVQEQKEKRREIPIEPAAPAQSGAPGKAA
jgi:HSP20 family protein